MKLKTILLTAIISTSLISKAQTWGNVLNTAKDAVITNSTTIIDEFAISKENDCIWVLCKSENDNSIKPWTLAEIRHENLLFIHSNLGSYFGKDGAFKQFTLAQGLEWTQGDTFDDYA